MNSIKSNRISYNKYSNDLIFIFLLLLGLSITCNAQIKITGFVESIDKQPIDYYTIELLSPSDSSMIEVSSFINGNFEFKNLREQNYLLRIFSMGYKQKYTLYNAKQNKDTIRLETDNYVLNEVVVSARKPLFRMKDDYFVATVSNSILSDLGNSIDVLKRIPMLIVSGKDNITIAGKDNVIIFINGRKLYSSQELATLNSSLIDKIEVITNPSAKYDADGHSVINIITKKAQQEGLTSILKSQMKLGRKLSNSSSIELMYKNHNLLTYFNYDYDIDNEINYEDFIRTTTTNLDQTILDYHKKEMIKENRHNYLTGIDYIFNPKHQLGLQFNGWFTEENGKEYSKNFANIKSIQDTINVNQNGKGKNNQNSLNINYQFLPDTLGQSLAILLDYTTKNIDNKALINEIYSIPKQIFKKKQSTNINFDLYSFKADYKKTYSQLRGELEVGIKYSKIRNKSAISLIDFDAMHSEVIENDNYSFNEKTLASYASFTKKIHKHWLLKAGVRVESINTEFEYLKQEKDSNYISFFPSLSISKTIANGSLSISYAKRISRPNYIMLNPTISYIDQYTYQMGNPDLKPTISDIIEASFAFNNTLFFRLGYTYKKNPYYYSFLSDDTNTDITKIMTVNYDKAKYYTATVNVNKTFWQKLVTYNTLGIRVPNLYIEDHGEVRKLNKPFIYFTQSSQLSLPLKINLYWDLSLYKPGDFDIFNYNTFYNLSIGIRRHFLNDKLIVNIYGNDILNTDIEKKKTSIGNLDMSHKYNSDNTYLSITVTYNIGNLKSTFTRKSGNETEKQRL